MGSGYWKGVALGGLFCAAVLAILLGRDAVVPTSAIVFTPSFTGESHPWILPGASKKFTVQLANRSTREARIEDLRFSCPCANGTVAGSDRLPVRIAPGDVALVDITVTSRKEDNGPLELRFGVVGHVDDLPVEAGAVAALRFVRHLNSEPSFLKLEDMNYEEGNYSGMVNVWIPGEIEPPATEITVESDDPCLSARIDRLATPATTLDGGNRKVTIAKLSITIDPEVAPQRLKRMPSSDPERMSCGFLS